jgi:hypothetical protein
MSERRPGRHKLDLSSYYHAGVGWCGPGPAARRKKKRLAAKAERRAGKTAAELPRPSSSG